MNTEFNVQEAIRSVDTFEHSVEFTKSQLLKN